MPWSMSYIWNYTFFLVLAHCVLKHSYIPSEYNKSKNSIRRNHIWLEYSVDIKPIRWTEFDKIPEMRSNLVPIWKLSDFLSWWLTRLKNETWISNFLVAVAFWLLLIFHQKELQISFVNWMWRLTNPCYLNLGPRKVKRNMAFNKYTRTHRRVVSSSAPPVVPPLWKTYIINT